MTKVQSKTKVIATLGPASSSREVLEEMIMAGVDVCRINFSHGDPSAHTETIKTIRAINKERGLNTAILADLQGPKLRIGEVENNGVELIAGEDILITTKACVGTSKQVYITYPQFPQDVKIGETVLIDDGKIVLAVKDTNKDNEVVATVVHGGILSSKKGVNLPNTHISLPSLTKKDLQDLRFALENDVEWIGLSFVRKATDILELKHIIQKNNKNARVVAKIEKPEAVKDIDNIVKCADALMVARGDLGVEIPMENVPLIQKMLVQKALEAHIPVIIATQMMESMIHNYNATRAEVNDVANSVMDGADAVMLSGETSVGSFPVRVIQTVQKILAQVEGFEGIYHKRHQSSAPQKNRMISDAICFNSVNVAEQTGAAAIVAMTHSGYTAFYISSFRPKSGIYIFTGNQALLNTLSLVWGVKGFFYDKMVSTDHTINEIKDILKHEGLVKTDDLIINVASIPMHEFGKTNMMKLSFVE
ncbi:MAG: pyruvate kinase [Bacteroidia bacterium]|nr:pyruvate kinase [Bacteroidia bacterium]MCC6768277.1 pyruvate kinase [Bacteroidia bacterium]